MGGGCAVFGALSGNAACGGATSASVLRDAADASEQPLWQHTVDVTDRESVQSLFAWARQELGKVDILINSAGMNIKTRTMAAMAPEQWDQVMQANATGAYNCYAGGPSRDA